MLRNIIAALALLAATGPAWPEPASAADGSAMLGPTGSCGTWTAERAVPGSPYALNDGGWVLGFLSGVGAASQNGDDPLRGMDAAGVLGWIDNYCHANPTETIAMAAAKFWKFYAFRSHGIKP